MTEKKLNEIEQNLTRKELMNNLKELKEQGFNEVLLDAVNDLEDLTITQTGMIVDFAGGKTITKISEDLKISRTTIYKWLKNEKVQEIIKNYRAEIFNASFTFLKNLNFKAMQELQQQFEIGDFKRRLEVAKYIIDTNIKLMELEKVWEKKSLELTEKKKGNESTRKMRIEEEKKR